MSTGSDDDRISHVHKLEREKKKARFNLARSVRLFKMSNLCLLINILNT